MAAVYPPQGSGGGGNPTGYSESGGVVTLTDALNVGTAADAVATGDFAAGLTGAARIHYDQSASILYLYESGGSAYTSLTAAGSVATLRGPSGVNLTVAGTSRVSCGATAVQMLGIVAPFTAGGSTLGSAGFPWGSLTLGDGTAQVLLGHDGATDGLLTVKDPNGVAGGALHILDAAGNADVKLYEGSGYAEIDGATGVRFRVAGAQIAYATAAGFFPQSSRLLGAESAVWSAAWATEFRGPERSSNPTAPAEGKFVIWMSDGTGHGDDGDVLIASQAGGTTNYSIVFDHSAGTTF